MDVKDIAPTIREIAKIQRNIKRKHKELTLGRELTEEQHAKHFKPLTEPLTELIETLANQPPVQPPVQPQPPRVQVEPPTPPATPIVKGIRHRRHSLSLPSIREEPAASTSGVVRKLMDDDEGEEEEEEQIDEAIASTRLGHYIRRAMTMDHTIDTVFGPRVINNMYYLGNKRIIFREGDIITLIDPTNDSNKRTYDATPGLCELIFMKMPDKQLVLKSDTSAYKRILDWTSVYRKNYASNAQIVHFNNVKYKKTIYPLIKSDDVSGRGIAAPFNMVADNSKRIEYVYYNDPNELVDRLRLLDQSRAVGNTGHENEINSILEELVEGHYIA